MTGFHEVTLGDVLTLQRGFDITKNEQEVGVVPIVSSSGISSYHNKWKVKGPGVIIGRKGTLGTVHYVSQSFWPHDTTLWIKDFKGNDPKFLALFLKTLKLENFDVGASNPTLNRNHVHKIKVIFPKRVQTQKQVAAILSAYEELIETNKRWIALLEGLAEEIYREWFVRLRFPGHKTAKRVQGLPVGWSSTPSSKVFCVMSGGTPNTDNHAYWDGEIPFFTPKDAGDNFYVLATERAITPKGLASCNSKLYKKNTIFITARGTVGKICLAYREMAMNQTCYALSSIEGGDAYFHFLSIKNAISYIKGVSKSGVFDNIIVDTFKIIPILMPTVPLISRFNDYTSPIFEQIGKLLEQNEALTRTRDLLLPRLISGKLSVENLNIQSPEGMVEAFNAEAATHA